MRLFSKEQVQPHYRILAIVTFKIVYGMSPSYLSNYLSIKKKKKKKKNSSHDFWYTNLLEVPRSNTVRFEQNSFQFQAAKLRNSLPEEARKITELDTFKAFIKESGGAQCRCALCRYLRLLSASCAFWLLPVLPVLACLYLMLALLIYCCSFRSLLHTVNVLNFRTL